MMEDIEYVHQSCTEIIPVVHDKLRVIGQKAVAHLVIDVWDTVGCDTDNISRVFNTDDCVYKDGLYYWSLEDQNIDEPPSAKWSKGYAKCPMLRPWRYVDPDGVEVPNGDCLITCDDIDNTTIQLVDGVLKAVVDTTVPWDEFWDQCHVVEEVPKGCSVKHIGMSTDAAGCSTLGWIGEDSSTLVGGGSEVLADGEREFFPDVTTDHTTYYDYPAFNQDNKDGNIDMTKLDRLKVFCFDVDIECSGQLLELEIGSTVKFDPANSGISRYVVSIDGDFPLNGAGETIATDYLTSYVGSATVDLDFTLDAGTHTICAYLIGGTSPDNFAQVVVSNLPGAKRPVYRLQNR